jgi:hypothetical protein
MTEQEEPTVKLEAVQLSPMHYVSIGLVVVLLALGTVYWLCKDTISGMLIEMDCKNADASEHASCFYRMRELGHFYVESGERGRATEWYKMAASGGDVQAMFYLGWVYHSEASSLLQARSPQTQQKATDYLKSAEQWYRAAAQHGFAPAMNNLGEIHLIGLDGTPQLTLAHFWHMKAASAGNPIGAANAMLNFMHGTGVLADNDMATRWEEWAAASASPADMAAPTLERTLINNKPLPAPALARLRKGYEAKARVRTSYDMLRNMGFGRGNHH